LVLFAPLFLTFQYARAATTEEIQSQINSIQQKINELEKQSSVYKGVINQKQQEEKTLNNQIAIFNAHISRLEADIVITRNQIQQAELEIEDLAMEIDIKEREIIKQKGNLVETIKSINEFDQEGLLIVLLKTNNISEAFNQIEYVDVLQGTIKDRLQEIKDLKSQMEEKKIKTQQHKDQQIVLKDGLENKQDALDSEKSNKAQVLKTTKGEESKYQALQNEVLKQRNQLAQQIKDLEDQIYREQKYIVHLTAPIPPAGKIYSWPEEGFVITQGYGMTSYAMAGGYAGSPHNGVDISAGIGSEIKSIGDGTVVAKGYNAFWGNWVAIQHTNGLISAYGHMIKSSNVVVGTDIKTGTIIGYEGRTGKVTGAHLHFSLYNDFFTYEKNDQLYFPAFQGNINPMNYL